MESQRKFGILRDPLDMALVVPSTGLVSGQIIIIALKIANSTRSDVSKINVGLIKKVLYKSQSPVCSKSSISMVKNKTYSSSSPSTALCTETYDIQYEIPIVSPSTLNSNRIIEVSYEFIVDVSVIINLSFDLVDMIFIKLFLAC